MEIQDIPNNSFRSTTQSKRVEKQDYSVMPEGTTSVTASKEKRKGKLMSLILPEDIPDISTYIQKQGLSILQNIVWPKIREIMIDSFTTVLGGKSSGRSSGSIQTISRVSYDQSYRSSNNYSKPTPRQVPPRPFYEDIGFDDPEIADDFMELVEDLFYDQGYISVLQFYNIAKRPTTPEQSNYGWKSINGMKRVYSHGIYYIDMPYPTPLEN